MTIPDDISVPTSHDLKIWAKWEKEAKLREKKRGRIFDKMKANEAEIHKLYQFNIKYIYEDKMYRFYHASFKVFWLIEHIEDIVKLLKKINPHRPYQFDEWFMQIIEDARKIGKFKRRYNRNFPKYARPILEAYLHCKYFLDMLEESLKMEEEPKSVISSGWAAILELYNIR